MIAGYAVHTIATTNLNFAYGEVAESVIRWVAVKVLNVLDRGHLPTVTELSKAPRIDPHMRSFMGSFQRAAFTGRLAHMFTECPIAIVVISSAIFAAMAACATGENH